MAKVGAVEAEGDEEREIDCSGVWIVGSMEVVGKPVEA